MIFKNLTFFAIFLPMAMVPLYSSHGQEVIFVARHVDPQKLLRMDAPIQDDTPLSETGLKQAQTLADRLRDAGLTAIYTSKTVRTIQTAVPLSEMLGLPINKISRRDTDGLLKQVRENHQKGRVLIIGHWTTLPGILEKLGYDEPVIIERSVRNDLFIVVPRADQPPVVTYIHY